MSDELGKDRENTVFNALRRHGKLCYRQMMQLCASSPPTSDGCRSYCLRPKRLYLFLVVCLVVSMQRRSPRIRTDVFDTHYEENHRAIFLISMGKQAQESKIVERFVWSANNRGKWNSWVVLLTDAPSSRYVNVSDNLIVMQPRSEHFNTSFAEDMPYKRFKTYIMEYLDMDPRLNSVRLVYYLDVDIVTIQPLLPMMIELESKHGIADRSEEPTSSVSKAWFFEGNYKKTPVQGGQMILQRNGSKPCLKRWRSLIDANPSQPKDQPYLLRMMKEPNQQCTIQIMPQEHYIRFPSNTSMLKWIGKYPVPWYKPNLKREDPVVPTMIHIKNSGKVGNVSASVEALFLQDILQLSPQEESDLAIGKKMHFKPDEV